MKQLIDYLTKEQIPFFENEPMANRTTFKIGGAARLLAEPCSVQQIADIVKICNQQGIRFMAIGNGSNLLVDDAGIDACVILLGKGFSEVTVSEDGSMFAQAGAPLIKLCKAALEHSLTGLEFAYGIPGSCGGAAFMNAGAYQGEMKDVTVRCDHVTPNGEIGCLEGAALDFSYRHSAYENNGCIITGIHLQLQHGDAAQIKAKMDDLLGRRKDKQPLEYPSAGSTFKRPEGYFAGALIEACGLKGASVGGAQVSEKHAGFVINKGGATCNDVLALCRHVADTVLREQGVELKMEIKVTK